MRNLILSALLLASAFQTALGEQDGDWTYSVSNAQATITAYTGAGGAVAIPSSVNGIPVVCVGRSDGNSVYIFGWHNTSVTSLTIPDSVENIGGNAFNGCYSLTTLTIGNRVGSIGTYAFAFCYALTSVRIPNSVGSIAYGAFLNCGNVKSLTIGSGLGSIEQQAFGGCNSLTSVITYSRAIPVNGIFPDSVTVLYVAQLEEIANNDAFVAALASNDAFVTAVANKIKATSGNYGITTQSGLSSAIEPLATKSELTPLATKTQITTAINEGRAAGIASVIAFPSSWSLFTSSQIQNMAIGDLVLTREVNGNFVLNYDIEQSVDMVTWTPYQALLTPLIGLPVDKAFVRIRIKTSASVSPPTVAGPGLSVPL